MNNKKAKIIVIVVLAIGVLSYGVYATLNYEEVPTADANAAQKVIMAVKELLLDVPVFKNMSSSNKDEYTMEHNEKTLIVKKNGEIIEKRPEIKIKIDVAQNYVTKEQTLYGRKIIGITDDGSYMLDKWEKIIKSYKGGDRDVYVDGAYAEFGYEFDIEWGTDFPYSDCFWRSDDGIPSFIFIDTGGKARNASIKITVEKMTSQGSKEIIEKVNMKNCDSHSRKRW